MVIRRSVFHHSHDVAERAAKHETKLIHRVSDRYRMHFAYGVVKHETMKIHFLIIQKLLDVV